jgi:hypothetical protein
MCKVLLIVAVIVKHSAVEPGATVLGVEITDRRYYTIYSLSAEMGIDRPRLCRLLKKLDQMFGMMLLILRIQR